jgi:hypothetical protein
MAVSCKSIGTGSIASNSSHQQPLKVDAEKLISFIANSSKEESSSRVFSKSYERTSNTFHEEQEHPVSETDDSSTSLMVDYIQSRLSADDLETAAMASYQYLRNPDKSNQSFHARKIVERYWNSKSNVETALRKLRATLTFRRSIDVVGLIKSFDKNEVYDHYSFHLQKHLSSKTTFVQGYDKVGRPTLYFIPRKVQGHDSVWTLKQAVYSIERAIACSKAKDGLINAVVDFSGFSVMKHSPPFDIGLEFVTTLRNHYVGQIHRIYMVDTPSTFSFFWKVFKPFIGTTTRNKIYFISNSRDRAKLKESYDVDQVPSWLISGGKKNRDLDLDYYLFETPFQRTFDE